jgi:hypothetical protein
VAACKEDGGTVCTCAEASGAAGDPDALSVADTAGAFPMGATDAEGITMATLAGGGE